MSSDNLKLAAVDDFEVLPDPGYLYCSKNVQTSNFKYITWADVVEMTKAPKWIDRKGQEIKIGVKPNAPCIGAHDGPNKRKESVLKHNNFTMLRIDLDDTLLDIDVVEDQLKAMDIHSAVVYTSARHQLEGCSNRYRVLIPLSTPLDFTQWRACSDYLAEAFCADTCGSQPNQIMYAPVDFDLLNYDYRVLEGKSLSYNTWKEASKVKVFESTVEEVKPDVPYEGDYSDHPFVRALHEKKHTYEPLNSRGVHNLHECLWADEHSSDDAKGAGFKILDDYSVKYTCFHTTCREKIKVCGHKAMQKLGVLSEFEVLADEAKCGEAPFYSQYVMTSKGQFLEKTGARIPLSKAAFDNKYANEAGELNKGKFILPSKYIIGKIETVHGQAYDPRASEVFSNTDGRMVNSYRAAIHEPVESHVEAELMIKKHLAHLLPREEDQGLILDWMAHQIQNPGVLVRYVPLIVGVQGDGKSTIYEILTRALGSTNTCVANDKDIASQFNGWANNSAVCCFEEIRVAGKDRYAIYNSVKPVITNSTVSINRKGLNQVNVDNVTNYLAFSNYKDAIPLDTSDRRWWVILTNFSGLPCFPDKEYRQYFTGIYDFIETAEGASQIYSFLNTHVISDKFKQQTTAPDTVDKSIMMIESYSQGTLAVLERVAHWGEAIEKDGELNITDMQMKERVNNAEYIDSYSKVDFDYPDLPKGKALCFALEKELGYVKQPRKVVLGKKYTIYKKP